MHQERKQLTDSLSLSLSLSFLPSPSLTTLSLSLLLFTHFTLHFLDSETSINFNEPWRLSLVIRGLCASLPNTKPDTDDARIIKALKNLTPSTLAALQAHEEKMVQGGTRGVRRA